MPQRFLVITGPTASGKSALVTALSQACPGRVEVINADAFQVYRGLDIGTAKPSLAERQAFPHHLYDILDPREGLNVALFVEQASLRIDEILRREHIPVVCGGTMFYIKHLLWGLPEAPPSDPVVKSRIELRLKNEGKQALYRELSLVDPVSAARLHENDTYRVVRALEVYETGGLPLSSYKPNEAAPMAAGALFYPDVPRPDLHKRIHDRCIQMRRAGLADEVEQLVQEGYTPDDPGMRAIGYREFFEGNSGSWTVRKNTDSIWEDIEIHTRQYAKRQMTFLRGLAGAVPLPMQAGVDTDVLSRLLAETGVKNQG